MSASHNCQGPPALPGHSPPSQSCPLVVGSGEWPTAACSPVARMPLPSESPWGALTTQVLVSSLDHLLEAEGLSRARLWSLCC